VTGPLRRGIADRLADAGGVLVGLDFDGTLAPIAADPDAPTITPACQQSLEALVSHPRASVAVISGRELTDLERRVGLGEVVYAGNHGLELRYGAHTVVHPAAARSRREVDRALERVAEGLADVPGLEIENKGLTATVHVRRTPARRIEEVHSAVEASVREANGLCVTSGKQVFEIRPAVDWDKGTAIDRIAREVPDGWLTVYLGDDVTDEDAFRAVRPDGIGVLVGSRDRTDAAYRLPTQTAVAPFLDSLVTLLERR